MEQTERSETSAYKIQTLWNYYPEESIQLRVRCFPAVHLNYFTQEFQSALEFLADAGYICRKAAVLRDCIKWTLGTA